MSKRSRLRSIRLLSFLLIPVVLSMAGGPWSRSTLATATAQEAPAKVIERWRGRLYAQASLDATAVTFGVLPGTLRETYMLDFDLKVYEDGFLNGDVKTTFTSLSFDQIGNTCGFFLKCRVGVSIANPVAHTFVEGQRLPAQNNEAEILLKHEIEISPATMSLRTSLGPYSKTSTEPIYADVLPVSPLKLRFYDYGRQPTAEARNPHKTSAVEDFVVRGQLIGTGEEPLLGLDQELLERSIFLAQVPVDDNFDANVDWNSIDAGWVTWQFSGEAPERVGPTRATKVPKKVNVGPPNPGQKTIQVQAHNLIGKDSAPETSQVTVAPPVTAPTTRTSPVTGQKEGAIVGYKFTFKYPEPVFKYQVNKSFLQATGIPFFSRGPLGIVDTQALGEIEVKSTGEGSGKAGVATGFMAMGNEAKGELTVKTKAVLTGSGLTFPEGEFELKISGKLKGEDYLIAVVPSVGLPLSQLAAKFPAIQSIVAKAKMSLEIEPKITLLFALEDAGGDIKFKRGEAKPAIGLKASLVLDLVKDVASITGSVGGEIAMAFQVPGPKYFKGGEIKVTGTAQVVLYHFGRAFERSITTPLPAGDGLAQAQNDGLAQVQNMVWDPAKQAFVPASEDTAAERRWEVMDRSYLDDANYGRWTAQSVAPQEDRYGPTDKELVANVFPQANPMLAAYTTQDGISKIGMVWVHDKPGSPALSGQDIMFTQGSVAQNIMPANDNLADLNPKLVFLPNKPDDNQLVVWQRFDTANLPDFNDDPGGYLSHAQIAAVNFNYNSSARPAPQYLSMPGSLNYRHQVGATDNGAVAVWINNPANQILGDATNPDRLLWARYTQSTGSWSSATPIIDGIAGLVDYKLATTGSHTALIYSQDLDGNMDTDGDRELFYTRLVGDSWSTPTRLTNNTETADEAPQLVLTSDGTPLIVWRQAGQLKFLQGWNGMPAPLALADAAIRSDFELVASPDGSAALTWQEVEPEDTRVGYAIYDAKHGRWGDVRSIATNTAKTPGTTTMANNITAALVPTHEGIENGRGRLYVGYQLANVQTITKTIEGVEQPTTQIGTHSLHLASEPLRANLSVTPADLRVTPAAAAPGQPLTLEAVIRNTGDLATPGDSVPVILTTRNEKQETTVVATRTLPVLGAGEAVTLTFPLARPAFGNQQYQVEINALDENFKRSLREDNYADNEAAFGSELAITAYATEYAPTGAVAQAQVTQSGGLYNGLVVSSTLHLGSPNGPVVGQAPISFPVTPTDTVIASSFISSTVLGPGSHQLWWKVDPEGTLGESKLDDNVTGTTVNIMPDLATDATLVGWNHAPGNAAPISLRVVNEGNWVSGASVVEFFDGEPGVATTHSLGRMVVPAIEAGGYAELQGTLNLAGLPAAATGLQSLYVQLDPDQTLQEINENNNLALVGGVLGGPLPDVPPPGGTYKLYLPQVQSGSLAPAPAPTATRAPTATSAPSKSTLQVVVTGGSKAGTYTKTSPDGTCSYGLVGADGWGNQYSDATDRAGLSSVQMIVPSLTAAKVGTSKFNVTFTIGNTNYRIEGRDGAQAKGSGTVQIDDRGQSATVTIKGQPEPGVTIDATIQCHEIFRVASPTPTPTSTEAGATMNLSLVGGPLAGSHSVTANDQGCGYGPENASVLVTGQDDPSDSFTVELEGDKIGKFELLIPQASAAAAGTKRFYLNVNDQQYYVDNLEGDQDNTSGTVSVQRNGGAASLTVQARTNDGKQINAQIQCNRVFP